MSILLGNPEKTLKLYQGQTLLTTLSLTSASRPFWPSILPGEWTCSTIAENNTAKENIQNLCAQIDRLKLTASYETETILASEEWIFSTASIKSTIDTDLLLAITWNHAEVYYTPLVVTQK